MRTRAIPTLAAVWLGVVMIPLAGCNRESNPVHADKDAQGNAEVHVDGQQVNQNVDKANQDFKAAGEQIKDGAQQVGEQLKEGADQAGAAIQRGTERVQERVEPVAKRMVNDASLTAQVKSRLAGDPAINALYIDVDTSNSRVTLRGKVGLAEQKTAAEKIARETPGVTDVVNLLQVAGGSTSAPPPAGQ
jgi:osmotically-inducible protein OsmY